MIKYLNVIVNKNWFSNKYSWTKVIYKYLEAEDIMVRNFSEKSMLLGRSCQQFNQEFIKFSNKDKNIVYKCSKLDRPMKCEKASEEWDGLCHYWKQNRLIENHMTRCNHLLIHLISQSAWGDFNNWIMTHLGYIVKNLSHIKI